MPIYKNKLVNKTLGFFKSLVTTASLSTVANQISTGIANKGKVKCPSYGAKVKWEDA